MGRSGRPANKGADRQPDGRVRPEKVGPTPELVQQRAKKLAEVIALYPEPLALTLAEQQDAGWYIGRLLLAKVITPAEREAAKRWKRISDDYARLLMLPKQPVALDMSKRDQGHVSLGEDERAIRKFKRLKRQYEQCWDAVAEHGPAVLRATTGALRDEETPLHLLRKGLKALVSV